MVGMGGLVIIGVMASEAGIRGVVVIAVVTGGAIVGDGGVGAI